MSNDPRTRAAWDGAAEKYVREHDDFLAASRDARLLPVEERVLSELVLGATVVHPLSGNGVDDHALVRLGAARVIGLEFTESGVDAGQRRADALGAPIEYRRAELPVSGLPDASADLVYTGKGALAWLGDLDAFFAETARILRPDGALFVYEAHPAEPLWTWEPDRIGVRDDRDYFADGHVNDTFPARGAWEAQRTMAETVMAVVRAGFALEHFAEHPDPFWAATDEPVEAWRGRVPNAFSLLAARPV